MIAEAQINKQSIEIGVYTRPIIIINNNNLNLNFNTHIYKHVHTTTQCLRLSIFKSISIATNVTYFTLILDKHLSSFMEVLFTYFLSTM